MSQRLLLPFDRQMIICGYKNSEYLSYWGYPHYGIDISTIQGGASDNHTVYASGRGAVVAVGKDTRLGYGVCVLYPGCTNGNKTCDLIARYMHMCKCYVKKGDKVTVSTPIGVEGKEGTVDYHLHLELDTDVNYPRWSPQVRAGLSFWKKGTDSTLNPSQWLCQTGNRVQIPSVFNPAWLNQEDKELPVVSAATEPYSIEQIEKVFSYVLEKMKGE